MNSRVFCLVGDVTMTVLFERMQADGRLLERLSWTCLFAASFAAAGIASKAAYAESEGGDVPSFVWISVLVCRFLS